MLFGRNLEIRRARSRFGQIFTRSTKRHHFTLLAAILSPVLLGSSPNRRKKRYSLQAEEEEKEASKRTRGDVELEAQGHRSNVQGARLNVRARQRDGDGRITEDERASFKEGASESHSTTLRRQMMPRERRQRRMRR